MVSRGLTEIQKKILEYIEGEVSHSGSPPSLRDIAKHFRFSAVGTVQGHIRALIQKGFLTKDPGRARGLRLSDPLWANSTSVPILGAIAAGSPREAEELILGSTPVPEHLARSGDLFALRVSGESMSGAGIHDGDLVIARQQKTAKHGEIVVALVEGASTVKRLDKKASPWRLLPENSDFEPIEIKTADASIQGKVVSVQRFYE